MAKFQPIGKTIKSVAAAFLGVQSDKNRKDDFAEGKFSHFFIVALVALVLFVLSLVTVVFLVIPS